MKKILTGLMAAGLIFLSGCAQETASLGVIGGADGPTAVFVSVGDGFYLLAAAIVAVIAAGAVILIRRKRK